MPNTPDSSPAARAEPGAVFLSYASEDAEAAQRISAALRSAGIEVWFDRSELRGGDAWDAKIRRQIKACALFIPIISGNSHARSEGYFRLEWKLAIDRSHLMATDRAFLLPVVIDGTVQDDERIPDRFRDVQWIHLPRGETPASFIAQVQRLLAEHPHARAPAEPHAHAAPAHDRGAGATPHADPAHAAPPHAPEPPRPGGKPGRRISPATAIALVLAGVLAIGAAAWIVRHFASHRSAVAPYSVEDRRMTFAVVPFAAPADNPRGQQVARATAEAVTASLEGFPLWARTAPRRSVEEASGRIASATALAKALDVHFLIRGTVKPGADGDTVDVAVLDGATEHVLATSELTVPADALVPRWRDDVNDAVFHLIYAALETEVKAEADTPADALDVRGLSFRAFVDWHQHRGAAAKEGYTSATDLLNRALKVAPDDPFATFLTAEINLCDCVLAWSTDVEKQKAIGAAALERYMRIDPNDPWMLIDRASLYQLRGRFEESIVILDGMLKRDPDDSNALATKAVSLLRLGKPQEAQAIVDKLLVRYPDKWGDLWQLAADIRYTLGDYAGAARDAARGAALMTESQLKSPIFAPVRLTQAAAEAHLGHTAQAAAALADFRASVPGVTTLAQIRKWMYPTANLYGYEPLFDGLKLAGVKD